MYELINASSLSTVVKKPRTHSVATATSAVDQTESTRALVCLVQHSCLCSSTFPLLHLTSPTQTLSFRSPSYHLPRLFTGFSETVGIASPFMKNVLSTTFPLTIKMLLDLEGLNCIHAHSILSVNFPNNRLVQATVVVMVVMSSMYALTGGSRIPEAKRSPPTTHLDALMITYIAMIKASGEKVHPAIIPTSKHCHVVLNFGVEKLNCKSSK